jgi:filamin
VIGKRIKPRRDLLKKSKEVRKIECSIFNLIASVPAKCKAYGPGLEKGETFIPTEFTIEAINANGRRVTHGSDPFTVAIKGPKSDVNYEFEDHDNGLYTVKYTPSEIGKHSVTVMLHGQNIYGSPFNVPVTRSPPDASKVKGKN